MISFKLPSFDHETIDRLIKYATNREIKRELAHSLKTPFQEQQKIAKILSTINKKLEIKKKEKEHLIKIKKDLMNLFLTGKVKVE